jgi:nitrate reductase NapE component
MEGDGQPEAIRTKRYEWGVFAGLAFLLAPVVAVLFVGGFGFVVWIWQMINGPPGPPAP